MEDWTETRQAVQSLCPPRKSRRPPRVSRSRLHNIALPIMSLVSLVGSRWALEALSMLGRFGRDREGKKGIGDVNVAHLVQCLSLMVHVEWAFDVGMP